MAKARFIRDVTTNVGTKKLWEITNDSGGTSHVVSSAVFSPFTGPETYIFAADADGKITDWLELDGSYRGGLDHEQAIRDAYEIVTNPTPAKE